MTGIDGIYFERWKIILTSFIFIIEVKTYSYIRTCIMYMYGIIYIFHRLDDRHRHTIKTLRT